MVLLRRASDDTMPFHSHYLKGEVASSACRKFFGPLLTVRSTQEQRLCHSSCQEFSSIPSFFFSLFIPAMPYFSLLHCGDLEGVKRSLFRAHNPVNIFSICSLVPEVFEIFCSPLYFLVSCWWLC